MIVLAILILALLLITIDWMIHLSMTLDGSIKSGWASYSTFIKWFHNYEWKGDNVFRGSLWNREMKCTYHAGIIKFEDVGMKINDPFSYFLVRIYTRKYIKNHNKNNVFSFQNELIKRKPKREGYNVSLPSGEVIYVSMEEIYGKVLE
ncbi:hypothetical protein [Paenibacillus sp. LK1]|uniref:hypothetical protein n=1 Tax=Paenibacillus sp. LK1 TaxID=2053014 RepID=UPI000C193D0D|nr:hypothetical protein [Paenibacillus sp. LK1]PIH59137.1 hypothetical protein CS562_14455 [Paenibacillus sp. LK1]